MSRKASKLGLLIVLFTPLASAQSAEPLEDVYFDRTDRATVLLSDLHAVNEMSPAARRSAWAPGRSNPYRHHVGVRVPSGTREGSSAWMDSPLITVEDAEIQVLHIDEGQHVMAGYWYPTHEGEERRPWMVYTDGDAVHAQCDFVIQAGAAAPSATLLEIVGLDPESVYFAARTAAGDDLLIGASYSVQVQHAGPEMD